MNMSEEDRRYMSKKFEKFQRTAYGPQKQLPSIRDRSKVFLQDMQEEIMQEFDDEKHTTDPIIHKKAYHIAKDIYTGLYHYKTTKSRE